MAHCPKCDIRYKGKTCKICGYTRDAADGVAGAPAVATHCICGGLLSVLGVCGDSGLVPTMTQGYTNLNGRVAWQTGDVACPYPCPICHHQLDWSGGCRSCHGSRTPDDKRTWTFPGDRHERDEGGIHWRKVEGPRACVPIEDVRELNVAIRAALKAIEKQSEQIQQTHA